MRLDKLWRKRATQHAAPAKETQSSQQTKKFTLNLEQGYF